MSRAPEIAVEVGTAPQPEHTAAARALLHEIAGHLQRLIEYGETAAIDLRSLPMGPADYQYLKDTLGRGEIEVELQALGPTRIYETAVSGVWWVVHYNHYEEVMAELLEITRCPELLQTPEPDLAESLERLRRMLHETEEAPADERR